MATRVYANGVKATAITNIKADVAALISIDADGYKIIDVAGLAKYLETQFQLISTTPEFVAPATADTSLDAAFRTDSQALALKFADPLSIEKWRARNDFPTEVTTMTSSKMISGIRSLMAECKILSDRITSYYYNLASKLFDGVTDFAYANKLDQAPPAGVVRLVDTRAYVQTYVTADGQESAPSVPSVLVRPDQNDTVTVTRINAPGGYNITRYRLYRSNTSDEGAAYQYVPNPADTEGFPIATATYLDAYANAELQEVNQTYSWDPPPANLAGVVAGANGGGAGFFNNVFCPWVNFHPYAFRVADRKMTEHPIVGIGVIGDIYVVVTRGFPYYIIGSDTSSMVSSKKANGQACVSQRGIVSMLGAVVYPSPDGLCVATPDGIKVVTGPKEEGGFGLFTKDDWTALRPSTIIAAECEGSYVFQYDTGTVVGMYSLDFRTGKLVKLTNTVSAFFRDLITDTLYYHTTGTAIWSMMTAATFRTARWDSKEIMLGSFDNQSWLKVVGKQSDVAPATIKFYGTKIDGTEVLLKDVAITTRKPVRMPQGKFDQVRIRVDSAARVTKIVTASSVEELKAGSA